MSEWEVGKRQNNYSLCSILMSFSTTFIVSSINSHCGLFLKYSIGFVYLEVHSQMYLFWSISR